MEIGCIIYVIFIFKRNYETQLFNAYRNLINYVDYVHGIKLISSFDVTQIEEVSM